MDAGRERPLAADSGILVIVTLYGGNGVSTVIPYTDNAYHDARADLASESSCRPWPCVKSVSQQPFPKQFPGR